VPELRLDPAVMRHLMHPCSAIRAAR
jgi:hypothetical protein